MASFGRLLRREREVRDVSLEEIAEASRIGVRYLRALEEERWGVLPGDVYVRNYIKAYAEYLGLDPERLLTEYEYHQQREDGERGSDRLLRRRRGETGEDSEFDRPIAIAVVMAAALAATILLVWWMRSG